MDKKKRRQKNPVHIGNIINEFLLSYQNKPHSDLQSICDYWENIVGNMVAKNSRPAAFKNKILLVHVTGASWIHNFQFIKKNIINKINSAMSNELVEDIKLVIGPVS